MRQNNEIHFIIKTHFYISLNNFQIIIKFLLSMSRMNRKMDTFEDRIDDDLFELIISYLPIKDKLRFESVSKRFQRLVFNKQNFLVLCSREDFVDNINDVLYKHEQINISKLGKNFK